MTVKILYKVSLIIKQANLDRQEHYLVKRLSKSQKNLHHNSIFCACLAIIASADKSDAKTEFKPWGSCGGSPVNALSPLRHTASLCSATP